MKYLLGLFVILLLINCSNQIEKKVKIKEAAVVEMVLYKRSDDVSLEEAQREALKLNTFISKQEGFISRNTSVSEDGQFLDIVYWTDLHAAKAASEKAMKDSDVLESFKVIDESEMVFKHFIIFNKQ